MDGLLGMYVHTHWAYSNPYAARTWTEDQWRGYLRGLNRLGYNLVQIWPMVETMPLPLTPSDEEHLEKLERVIRFAHDELSMRVYIGVAPNVSANEKAAQFPFQKRNYFDVEALINPADRKAMDQEFERRRVLLEPLDEVDGLWVIDSDPGGWKGSSVSDFVEILARHRELLDKIGSGIQLIYWMWAGWVDEYKWDPETTENAQSWWVEALEGLKRLNPEPWAVHACWPGHFKSLQVTGTEARAHFYPYNLVEYEPAYPYTNWEPERIARAFEWASQFRYPMGVLANSQTHCVQIPHAYAFSHFAQGGTLDKLDPIGFGERLIVGHGETLARAWHAMRMEIETMSPEEPLEAARALQALLTESEIPTGDLEGLFFGSPRRYIEDLKLQLELWASILHLKEVKKPSDELRPALKRTVEALRAWQSRHQFPDRYHDVYYYSHVHPVYEEAFKALGTPAGDRAVRAMDMFAGNRHGVMIRMMDAFEKAIEW